ncbi:MAG: PEP-CTERM/exosortase system-associated acyltransferase [Methyloprofundus sp.]|nr:PEP-CTERM/exosortase system-associated acyltransferase [Methyloprofundus sp.]
MFDKYFEVILANTQKSREIHYNIRYQVYCEELGYEDVTQFPNQQEFDKWDPQNDHDQGTLLFLVRLKHTGQWIAAMRVVHCQDNKLPLHEFSSLDHNINNSVVEFSRLCIVKEIRKPYVQNAYGINEANTSDYQIAKDTDENEHLKYFYSNPKVKNTIIWGLINAAMKYSADNHIKEWYLLTNRALARVIRRQGFTVDQVGEACEHRGQRAPYRFDVKEVQGNPMWKDFRKGYRVYSQLSQQEAASYVA